jgi:hypothetical protein
MKISELVDKLEKMKKEHGDINVVVQTLSHAWAPEPELRPFKGKPEYVLLNP